MTARSIRRSTSVPVRSNVCHPRTQAVRPIDLPRTARLRGCNQVMSRPTTIVPRSGPRRRVIRTLVASLALCWLVVPPTHAAELGADLEGLLAYARAQSPELAAMRHEAEAAVQRVKPAGA